MIKFFRRIRQKKLSENKTSKYFKYAIGEILLVVIGILIALQINDWNAQNKKENLKKEYVNSLIIDLVKDTLQIYPRLQRNKIRTDSLRIYGSNIENGHYTTLEQFISLKQNFSTGMRVKNTYNTNSFNLLISSGNIDLFEKQLRAELMELNRLQIAEKTVQNGNSSYLFRFMENISLKYPYIGDPLSSDKTSKLLWKNAKINDLPKDLTNIIIQEEYTLSRYIELTEKVMIQTKLVLLLLNKQND